MPTAIDLGALAAEIKAAQDSALQLPPFTTRVPGFDLSVAYKVARLVHRSRLTEGAKPIGRKIGFTNADMWSKFGVCEPIWVHIYERLLFSYRPHMLPVRWKGLLNRRSNLRSCSTFGLLRRPTENSSIS